jgi:proteasome assembly chaperone (PAC2) family protein
MKSMSGSIVMLHQPPLRDPALIVGFGGWPNAGEVATWVVTYLIRSLGATKCAEFKPDPFFDLVQQRPVVTVEGGRIQSVQFPGGAFHAARASGPSSRDFVLFQGQEPHFQWPQFVESFLDVTERLGVTEILTVGGLYDNVPHTVEPRVSGLTSREKELERFLELGIRPATYEGPMSIHTHIVMAAGQRNLPSTSIWGHVPYYIQSNNAKTCLAILERLQKLLDFRVDLKEVRRAAEMLDDEVDRIVQSKPELRQYIQNLETEYAAGEVSPDSSSRTIRHQSTGEKVIHIDPFLRRG